MRLVLKRFVFGSNYTIGNLWVNDNLFCQVLEDKVREVKDVPVEKWKVMDQTAITKGIYDVTIDHSEHRNRDMLHVLDVPGFEGIRIHGGNSDKDTSGCLLVGQYTIGKGNWMDSSQATLARLYPVIASALARGEEVKITVG